MQIWQKSCITLQHVLRSTGEEIIATSCTPCHVGAVAPEDLRFRITDYDGDGDGDEIATMAEPLMAEPQGR